MAFQSVLIFAWAYAGLEGQVQHEECFRSPELGRELESEHKCFFFIAINGGKSGRMVLVSGRRIVVDNPVAAGRLFQSRQF